jgi:CHRD domain-containing protein
MPRSLIPAVCIAALTALPSSLYAQEFSARLTGFEEVGGIGAGQTGAIFSNGTGKLTLDVENDHLTYKLTYSGLSASVTQAHIHFGKRHVGGGIMVFFCTNLGNGPAGTPTCPASGGTVTGTLNAASVVGPLPQNVTPANFNAVVKALNSDTAYANIHTTSFPAGEIRGQIRRDDRDDD